MEVGEGNAPNPVVVLEALPTPLPPQANGTALDEEFSKFIDDEEGGIRIGDIYVPPAPKPALSTDGDGPRLIITKIVNENFKSYAGTQVLGPFHKVCAIVEFESFGYSMPMTVVFINFRVSLR